MLRNNSYYYEDCWTYFWFANVYSKEYNLFITSNNDLKTQMAIKFFICNERPREVWLWLMETKQSVVEWDSVKKTKYRMKKELFKD